MQGAGRRMGDFPLVAETGELPDQGPGAGCVRAGGQADQHLVRQGQNVAAIGMAFGQFQHGFEQVAEGGGEIRRLFHARGGAGLQQDRAFGEDEGGILHEDGIGIVRKRREDGEIEPGRAQRLQIGGMFAPDPFEGGAFPIARAQAVDDRFGGQAHDGAVEIEDGHGVRCQRESCFASSARARSRWAANTGSDWSRA